MNQKIARTNIGMKNPLQARNRQGMGHTSMEHGTTGPTELKFKDAQLFEIKKEVAKKLADKGHIRTLLCRMHQHNFDLNLLEGLDRLQLLRAICAAHTQFSRPDKYPSTTNAQDVPDEIDLAKMTDAFEAPGHLVDSMHRTLLRL